MEIQEIHKQAKLIAIELGNPHYSLKRRTLKLYNNDTIHLRGNTDYFYLLGDPANLRVESDIGIYDTAINPTATGRYTEESHEHFGQIITIQNRANAINKIVLYQQIFKDKNFFSKKTDQQINIQLTQNTTIK